MCLNVWLVLSTSAVVGGGASSIIIILKGTVSVISNYPPCKDSNAWFTSVSLISCIIWSKMTEDIVVFLNQKCVQLRWYLRCVSHELVKRNPKWNKTVLMKKTLWISKSYLTRQSYQGYRCKLGIAITAIGGSLEITLILPLREVLCISKFNIIFQFKQSLTFSSF